MMTTAERLHALLETHILLLDGAMGTMIQRRRLTEATSGASGSAIIRAS